MKSAPVRVVVLLLAVVATLGIGIAATNHSFTIAFNQHALAEPPSEEVLAAADRLSEAFQYVADAIAPSVVTVRSTREVDVSTLTRPRPRSFFFGTPFDDLLNDNFFERFEQSPLPNRRQFMEGQGSGVIVDRDGYILTNSHVVADASEVTVILTDDRRYTAEVIGTDPKTDIAVIRIDADDLRPARIGNSNDLRVGQWVVAAGNPFGLSSSITTGIVSAKGRSGVGITDYEDFIQTDAAINRGNSGGPLVNLRGEVVGINTAIISQTGGSVGIGFAIPINMATDIMDELIDTGRVVRGFLGVYIQDLTEDLAQSFGYEGRNGALVGDVMPEGPAAEAGVQPGDIITHVNGELIPDAAQLRLKIAAVNPGEACQLAVVRRGKTQSFEIEIGELPSEQVTLPSTERSDLNLGMTIETLNSRNAERFGADSEMLGVVVTAIEPFGPAARASLQRGDVITHVDDEAVESANTFRQALRQHDLSQGVRLTVHTNSQQRFVFIRVRG